MAHQQSVDICPRLHEIVDQQCVRTDAIAALGIADAMWISNDRRRQGRYPPARDDAYSQRWRGGGWVQSRFARIAVGLTVNALHMDALVIYPASE